MNINLSLAPGTTVMRLILLVLMSVEAVLGYKILLSPAVGKSHALYFGKLALELQARGHTVAMLTNSRVTPPPSLSSLPWRHYPVDTDPAHARRLMNLVADNAVRGGGFFGNAATLQQHMELFNNEADQLFRDDDTITWLREQKFDFAVVDLPLTLFGLPYLLDIPFAYFSVFCYPWSARVPFLPSYASLGGAPYAEEMSFLERMTNALSYLALTPVMMPAPLTSSLRRHLPPGAVIPPGDGLVNRADLCFLLKEAALDTARPHNPNMIYMGSIMAQPAGQLPPELVRTLEDARAGVILMSFGSLFEEFPEEILQKFVTAFARLDYTILWKSNEEIAGASSNVRTLKWLPQNDLLGHPKVKAFVTHGGMNSVLESVYHGVPMVLFPLGIDQGHNAALAREKRYGVTLQLHDFTAEQLLQAITDVTQGNYTVSVRSGSEFLRSLPPAGDTASYWIEHVIKHGRKFIRPKSQDLPWYQLLMLDILAFLAAVLSVLLIALIFIIKLVLKIIKSSKGHSKTE